MGIEEVGQVCVMIHCGSRGLGHQVATGVCMCVHTGMLWRMDYFISLLYINSPSLGMWSISVSACLSLCLFVCLLAVSNATCPNFTKFFYLLTPHGAGVPNFRLCSSLVHSHPHFCFFYFFFPLLIRFTYFSSIVHPFPFFVSRREVVGGERTWV